MSDFLPDTSPNVHTPEVDALGHDLERPDAHRLAERVYIGTLLQWRPGYAKPEVVVPDEWLTPIGVAARKVLRGFKPWPAFPSLAMISELRLTFAPEKVVDEVAAYTGAALHWGAVDDAARALEQAHAGRLRDERRRARLVVIREMLHAAGDKNALPALCAKLLALE